MNTSSISYLLLIGAAVVLEHHLEPVARSDSAAFVNPTALVGCLHGVACCFSSNPASSAAVDSFSNQVLPSFWHQRLSYFPLEISTTKSLLSLLSWSNSSFDDDD